MKNKRVLMIGPFPDPTTGVSLANKVVKNILNSSKNFSVSHINTSYNRFDESIGIFSFHKLIFNLSFYFKLLRVLKCDILYITPGQSFYGVLKYAGFIFLGALSRKQIITHIHGNHLGKEYASLNGIKRMLFKRVLSKTSKGIVLSQSLRQNLSPFIPESQIVELPNFAENYLYTDASTKQHKSLKVIYLSNLMKEKGILDLLDALQILENKQIPYKAKIAGAIDHLNKDKIAKKMESLKHTSYVGIVQGPSKKELLEWGNVFVLPTYYAMEGQPISILEALSTGNVILTTKHAGIPDIIEEGVHGYFVEKKNPTTIAERLIKINIESKHHSGMISINKTYFKHNFTAEMFEKRVLEIFMSS